MGNYISLPILAFAAILQSTFVPQIRILGGMPDLVFLLVLSWSIHAELESGITWVFIGGILQDLLSASPTGASVMGMLLVVFAVSQLRQQVYRIGFLFIVALVLGGTLVKQVVALLILGLVGFRINPLEAFPYIIVPTAAYNLVFIWPVYWFIRRVQRRVIREIRAS